MSAVISFRLIDIRQTCKNNGDFCFFRRCNGFGDLFFSSSILCCAVTLSVEDRQTGCGFKCACGSEAVNVGTATALETGLIGKFTDKRYGIFLPNGQDLIIVFEKHHTVSRDLCCKLMLCFFIPGSVGFCVLGEAEDNVQNSLDCLIDNGFIQFPGTYSLNDLFVIDSPGRGHFQIQACCQPCHTVRNSAPVADHIALKPPFFAQNVGQQPGVFRGKNTV